MGGNFFPPVGGRKGRGNSSKVNGRCENIIVDIFLESLDLSWSLIDYRNITNNRLFLPSKKPSQPKYPSKISSPIPSSTDPISNRLFDPFQPQDASSGSSCETNCCTLANGVQSCSRNRNITTDVGWSESIVIRVRSASCSLSLSLSCLSRMTRGERGCGAPFWRVTQGSTPRHRKTVITG